MVEYKAILFDVGGTLASKDWRTDKSILRSETLPQTLEKLSNEGVNMFIVSIDAYPLMRHGLFRDGLLKPIDPNGPKLSAFDRILRENGLKPNEVPVIGDDERDEWEAAKTLGITFIKVEHFVKFSFPIPGNKENLENKLREAFPSILAKKDVLSDASGLKRKMSSEPKSPGRKVTT